MKTSASSKKNGSKKLIKKVLASGQKDAVKRAVSIKVKSAGKIPSQKVPQQKRKLTKAVSSRTTKALTSASPRKKGHAKKAVSSNANSAAVSRKRSAAARKGWETRRQKIALQSGPRQTTTAA